MPNACAGCGHHIGSHHDRALRTACAPDAPTQVRPSDGKRIPVTVACACQGFTVRRLSTKSDKGAA